MTTVSDELQRELEKFRTRCFWWVRRDLPLLELPRETLLHGLHTYGGWDGMRLAARL